MRTMKKQLAAFAMAANMMVCGSVTAISTPVFAVESESDTDADQTVLQVPTVSIQAIKGSSNRITLTGTFNEYDDASSCYEVISHGILFITNSKLNGHALTVSSSGRTNVICTSYTTDGSFSYQYRASKATTVTCARAYLVYRDENGRSVYVYSDPIVYSYKTL